MYRFIDLYALYFASLTTSFFHATMEYFRLLDSSGTASLLGLNGSLSSVITVRFLLLFCVCVCVCGGGGHSATMHTIFDQALACSEYEEEFRLHVLASFSRLSP